MNTVTTATIEVPSSIDANSTPEQIAAFLRSLSGEKRSVVKETTRTIEKTDAEANAAECAKLNAEIDEIETQMEPIEAEIAELNRRKEPRIAILKTLTEQKNQLIKRLRIDLSGARVYGPRGPRKASQDTPSTPDAPSVKRASGRPAKGTK